MIWLTILLLLVAFLIAISYGYLVSGSSDNNSQTDLQKIIDIKTDAIKAAQEALKISENDLQLRQKAIEQSSNDVSELENKIRQAIEINDEKFARDFANKLVNKEKELNERSMSYVEATKRHKVYEMAIERNRNEINELKDQAIQAKIILDLAKADEAFRELDSVVHSTMSKTTTDAIIADAKMKVRNSEDEFLVVAKESEVDQCLDRYRS